MGLYVILMGVQGAGKGEQAKFISQTYQIPHVSTGDLFRAMRTRTDELAQRIQAITSAGNLVDDDTTNEVVKERLSQPDAQNGVILDGYPRTPAQAAWFENYLAGKGEKLSAVILLELDHYTAFKRAYGRVSSADGQTTYNVYTMPNQVDVKFNQDDRKAHPPQMVAVLRETGETLTQRADDANGHAIIKRIDLYLETTQPLIEYFNQQGVVRTVQASQSIAEVSAEIKKILDQEK